MKKTKPTDRHSDRDRMQCMEVWGGNSPVNRGFDVPGLEVWVYSRPYERAEGGGDVYYVSSCASGRITRLLVADVSGHGEAVANVAIGLRDLMRRNVNLISQGRFVREMNQQFPVGPNSEIFATALVCTFFAPTKSLQFYNAGHPIPFLYRQQQGTWSSAQALSRVEKSNAGLADTPLGLFQEADYSRFETKLTPGDMVLCVSDAFTEAQGSDGKMLGTDGLLKIVQRLDVARPDELIPQLVEQVDMRQMGNLNQDDATVLLFRANGSKPPWENNLFALYRWLFGVRDKTGIH